MMQSINKESIKVEKILLQKFAEFTKLVMSELKDLKLQLSEQMKKEASQNDQQQAYHESVVKIADSLEASDFDFIISGDRKKFIKKAASNPQVLAAAFEKVCEAADVSLIGRPARVAANKKIANTDPVYARAFGFSNSSDGVLDLED